MRKLPHPQIDDIVALDKLSKSRATSAKAIKGQHPDIRNQFLAYVAAGGDPWQVAADPVLAGFRVFFEDLYKTPPVAIGHIKQLRTKGITGACPMCGRDSLGTLDHYLPQSTYPEFCFYSRNLIPACSRCNTARGNAVKGLAMGERALHPYFDAFAANRVMTVQLLPDWRAPEIMPVPFNIHGPALAVVQWQIDKVVVPSGFVDYAAPIWGTLVDTPSALLGTVPTLNAVYDRLQQLEGDDVAMSQSQNSWRSCIFHGIRHEPGAVAFLTQRLQEDLQP